MRKAVLIVDDVPDLLHLMEEAVVMVLPNHEVFTASTGVEARRILKDLQDRQVPLGMVVADQSLGDLDGLQLLAEAKPTGARLILVTGRASHTIETQAEQLDALVLWKPFRLSDLLALLRTENADDAG